MATSLYPRDARAQHVHQAAPEGATPPATTPDVSFGALELQRLAAGTAWQPESVPHAGFHATAGDWNLMFHGLLFAGYDMQGGNRGSSSGVGMGWLMAMADRRLGTGHFAARVMLSPEPLTVANGGYPLLLQTGETYKNQSLIDRQHPHDLFMEIAAIYTMDLGPATALQLYAAPVGEPALGPPGFPHRISAASDPMAPIGHHWQDSTHISFGVLTAGFVTRHLKLEGSWFNGREPDEKRSDIELHTFDSFAARLSASPVPSLVGQVSVGYLSGPEALAPDQSVRRVTASVSHYQAFSSGGHCATTAAYGYNKEEGEFGASSALLETDVNLDGRNVIFGRAEYVRKAGNALALPGDLQRFLFDLGTVSVGYLRNLGAFAGVQPGVGVRGTVNLLAQGLEPFYSSRHPLGAILYLRLASAATTGGHSHN